MKLKEYLENRMAELKLPVYMVEEAINDLSRRSSDVICRQDEYSLTEEVIRSILLAEES